MKLTKYFVVVLFLTLFTTSLLASPNKAEREVAEENYLEGVQSENVGLKVSCAFFLGEMKSTKAVIPLMRILREDNCDGARLAAALALVKIGDARGIYMVKKSVEFNDCPKVRVLAKHLYTAYVTGILDTMKVMENTAGYATLAKLNN